MGLNAAQVDQLLMPINTSRVLRDGKGHPHVSQQDILAHLIRVFGFGSFDIDVLDAACIFEAERGEKSGRYDVCYRAMVRVTIRDESGAEVAHYENGSTATAQNQTRGDAHDLAYKSAISLSVKRACIPLGDQFGLSLYNKGQTSALVRGTLTKPRTGEPQGPPTDVQEGVPQQVSLGNDEIDTDDAHPPAPEPERTAAPRSPESPLLDTSGKLAKRMFALFGDAEITDKELRLTYVSDVVGRVVTSSSHMTDDDARKVIAALLAELEVRRQAAQPDTYDEPPGWDTP